MYPPSILEPYMYVGREFDKFHRSVQGIVARLPGMVVGAAGAEHA
jgi:hypothetical protein